MRTGATTAAIVVLVAANAVVGLDPLESAHGRLVFSTLVRIDSTENKKEKKNLLFCVPWILACIEPAKRPCKIV